MRKRLLLVPAASAAALVALSPVAFAKGGAVAPPPAAQAPAQLGNDLAVVLGPTAASPTSQGSFQYTNLAGKVQLLAQVKGATFAGLPVTGPAEIDLTTRSLDCTTAATTAIAGMAFSARGEAKFQTASAPALTGLSRSRTTVAIVSTSGPSAGTTVALSVPEPCVPGGL